MTPPWRWCLVLLAAPSIARGQPRSDAPLRDAASQGARDQARARLDRYRDMAAPGMDEDDAAVAGEGSAEPVAGTTSAQAWSAPGEARCDLLGAIEPVDLQVGDLLAVQVALASRGTRAVALVTLGRPGRGRIGMVFTESRWVEWEGARTHVTATPGFEPDAALALGDDGAAVLSYTHEEPAAEGSPSSPSIAFTALDLHGRVRTRTRVLDATEGLQIDSNPVSWGGGTAVVLGGPVAPLATVEHGAEGHGRAAWLYFLDAGGRSAREPLELGRDTGDDSMGRFCAGLAASEDGRSLAAAWSVPESPEAGIWARRGITLGGDGEAPRRLVRRAGTLLWGPSPTAAGVVFARGSDRASGPAELAFVPWRAGPRAVQRTLGTWWDPVLTWTPAGLLVAGQAASGDRSVVSVAHARLPATTLRSLDLSGTPLGSLAGAVDVAIAPAGRGALVAWIDAADPASGSSRRGITVARVACTSPPADASR